MAGEGSSLGCTLLLAAALSSSCAPTLHASIGTTRQGGEKLNATICRLAEEGWCAQDRPRLAIRAVANCDAGRLRVAILEPEESRIDEEVPGRLLLDTPTVFVGPCFQQPKTKGAKLVVHVSGTCLNGTPRTTIECEMP